MLYEISLRTEHFQCFEILTWKTNFMNNVYAKKTAVVVVLMRYYYFTS